MTYILLAAAITRFEHPETVDGFYMILVAIAGLLANLVMLKILGGHGHSHGGHSHGGHGDEGHGHNDANEGHGHSHDEKKETHGHSHGQKKSTSEDD